MEIRTSSDLYSFLDAEYALSEQRPLHIIVCFSRIKPQQLPGVAQQAERSARVNQIGENLYEVKLHLKKRGVSGWLVVKGPIWQFYLDSVNSHAESGNILESWISGMFPSLAFGRVESVQLLDILDSLDSVEGAKLGLADYLLKSFPGGYSSKNWVRGDPYRRKELERIVSFANKVLHAIHFELFSDDVSFEARFSRFGHLVYYGGSKRGFESFYRLVVDSMISAAIMHRDRLSEKEKRVVGENVKVSPIVYHLDKKTLSPRNDFERIQEAMSTGSGYYSSLLSSGNPWLYLHLIDRGDGSIYDLYAFEKRLELVPLDKATPESLSKLNALIEETVPEAKAKLQ